MELAPMDLIQVSHYNINETQREEKLKVQLKKKSTEKVKL